MIISRKPYPTDVSDDVWYFIAPYLLLLPEDAGQRRHALREVLNPLHWIVRAGAFGRVWPNDFVDQGYTGEKPAGLAADGGMEFSLPSFRRLSEALFSCPMGGRTKFRLFYPLQAPWPR